MTLGVEVWEARETEGRREVTGLGKENAVMATLHVGAVEGDADQLAITTADPGEGKVILTRDGQVVGAEAGRLVSLVRAMSSDLEAMNKAGMVVGPEAGGQRDGAPTEVRVGALNNRFIGYQGYKSLGWSMWGYTEDRPVDGAGWCQGGYTRTDYSTQIVGGANASCWFTGWLSDDPYDCRAMLHVGIAGWRTSTCQWFIYQNGPDI